MKKYFVFVIAFIVFANSNAIAQDPALPPTNLGLSNLMDGMSGPPGWIYVNYTQVYQTRQLNDASGNSTGSDLKINSLASLHQFIWATPVKLLGGYLGFTVVVPIVKISTSNKSGLAPPVNPDVLGDIVEGTSIRWPEKKIFNRMFSQRIEFDISFPTGSYNQSFAINASSHLYTFSLYHTFTYEISKAFNISIRNQYNINTHILDSKARPGNFYNGNYSIEYGPDKHIRVELLAYYLKQFNQDKYSGEDDYYLRNYGISDTREQTFALGAGIAYLAPGGKVIELKSFAELESKNRSRGIRPTLKLAFPLTN